jgi:hypothetical protein
VHGCVYSLELGLLFIQLSGIVIWRGDSSIRCK